MFIKIVKIRHFTLSRCFAGFILFVFVISLAVNSFAQGQINGPVKSPFALTPAFSPTVIRGLVIEPDNPLRLNFLISPQDVDLAQNEKSQEYQKLIRYFLAALTIPEKDLWVNLSPYEKNRLIPDDFGRTEMGRDLLQQDYVLKQLSASLTNPDTELGKQYWEKVGTVPALKGTVPTFSLNKVWIVPDRAAVYEKNNAVFLVESHLKVMMEEDYVREASYVKRETSGEKPNDKFRATSVQPLASNFQAPGTNHQALTTNSSIQVFRRLILPAIEKEVNEGKNFAVLRQITNSLILATWYKTALKESLLGKVYADRARTAGVEQEDMSENQRIYERYVQAFKKGSFNVIKEEFDPVTEETIPRKYFSGGYTTILASSSLSERIIKLPLSPYVDKVLNQRDTIERVDVNLVEATSSSVKKPADLSWDEFEKQLKAVHEENLAESSRLGERIMREVSDIQSRLKILQSTFLDNPSLDVEVQESPEQILNQILSDLIWLDKSEQEIDSNIRRTISSFLQWSINGKQRMVRSIAQHADIDESYISSLKNNSFRKDIVPSQKVRFKIIAGLNQDAGGPVYQYSQLTPLHDIETVIEDNYQLGRRIYLRVLSLAIDVYHLDITDFVAERRETGQGGMTRLLQGLTDYIGLKNIIEKTGILINLRQGQSMRLAVRSRKEDALLKAKREFSKKFGPLLQAARIKKGLSVEQLWQEASIQQYFALQKESIAADSYYRFEIGNYFAFPRELLMLVTGILNVDGRIIDDLRQADEKLKQDEEAVRGLYHGSSEFFAKALTSPGSKSVRQIQIETGIPQATLANWKKKGEPELQYFEAFAKAQKIPSFRSLWPAPDDLQVYKFGAESGIKLLAASSALGPQDPARRNFLRAAGAGAAGMFMPHWASPAEVFIEKLTVNAITKPGDTFISIFEDIYEFSRFKELSESQKQKIIRETFDILRAENPQADLKDPQSPIKPGTKIIFNRAHQYFHFAVRMAYAQWTWTSSIEVEGQPVPVYFLVSNRKNNPAWNKDEHMISLDKYGILVNMDAYFESVRDYRNAILAGNETKLAAELFPHKKNNSQMTRILLEFLISDDMQHEVAHMIKNKNPAIQFRLDHPWIQEEIQGPYAEVMNGEMWAYLMQMAKSRIPLRILSGIDYYANHIDPDQNVAIRPFRVIDRFMVEQTGYLPVLIEQELALAKTMGRVQSKADEEVFRARIARDWKIQPAYYLNRNPPDKFWYTSSKETLNKAAADLLKRMTGLEELPDLAPGYKPPLEVMVKALEMINASSSAAIDSENVRGKSTIISEDQKTKGGIDLNPANTKLEVRRDGASSSLKFNGEGMLNPDFKGLSPIILEITPARDVVDYFGGPSVPAFGTAGPQNIP